MTGLNPTDFCHRCSSENCPYVGQRTSKSCLCHTSREDMMLAEIEYLREMIAKAVADEREACAMIADDGALGFNSPTYIAEVIRARGEKEQDQ